MTSATNSRLHNECGVAALITHNLKSYYAWSSFSFLASQKKHITKKYKEILT